MLGRACLNGAERTAASVSEPGIPVRGERTIEEVLVMRNGFKVFDADAHVNYPPDLWSRFLDKQYRDRVGRRPVAGFDHYNPVTVDGRYTQHLTSILGQFQKAINWTTDDMIAKYGDIITAGFTGDRVA